MDIKQTLNVIKNLYMSDNALNMLVDFERVLDNADIYVFPNWAKGELVEGPIITKYFVICKFMWPEKKMPDPAGAERLISFGVRVRYNKTTIKIPMEIKDSSDYRDGSRKAKLADQTIWVVEIMMPKNLMKDIKQGSKEIAGTEIDLSDLASAYEKGFQEKALKDNSQQSLEADAGAINV